MNVELFLFRPFLLEHWNHLAGTTLVFERVARAVPIGGEANGAEAPQQWGFAGTAAARCVQGRQGHRAA